VSLEGLHARFKDSGEVCCVWIMNELRHFDSFLFLHYSDLSKVAKETGTSYVLANNATWALTVCSGSIANFTYCAYLLTKVKRPFGGRSGARVTFFLMYLR
jgi:hypothetical protein